MLLNDLDKEFIIDKTNRVIYLCFEKDCFGKNSLFILFKGRNIEMKFLDRLKIEQRELDEKICKLKIFMNQDKFNDLDKINQNLLREQYTCMINYSAILKIRIRHIEK